MTLKELKQEFVQSLAEKYPSEEIHSFFYILTEKLLQLSRLQVALDPEKNLSEKQIKAFKNAIEQLQQYKPIQYIAGETQFYSLPFLVNKHTLIPRPETEELVEWIIEDNQNSKNKTTKLLDIGTGSGCISISLAKNLKYADVSALDISDEALKIAQKNAGINGVKVSFFQDDILKTETLPDTYNIIVSNPPYVRQLEKKSMQPNVLKFEPDLALFVEDNDPLLFYRKIAQLAKKYLTANGLLYFEINEYLSEDLVKLLEQEDYQEIVIRKDLFGKDRMIKSKVNA